MDIAEVFHEKFHVFLGELAGGGGEPVAEHAEFGNVEFEEFDVVLSFFIVFVVFFLGQACQFLLDCLETAQDSG